MAYTDRNTITAYLNGKDITPFLDDESSGDLATANAVLALVIATCSTEVDGYLAGIYPTPFSGTIPAAVKSATAVFVCEALYERRLTPDEKNPFSKRADMWRKILNDIRENGTGLDYAVDRAFEPGAISTAPVVFCGTTM